MVKDKRGGKRADSAKAYSEKYLKNIKMVERYTIVGILLGVVVFVAIALFGGVAPMAKLISSMNANTYAMAFICVFGGYLLRYVKWEYYLGLIGLKVKKSKSFVIYMSLYSMNITPGKIGRIISAYTLNKVTKAGLSRIAPIIAMDIFTDFLGLAILTMISAFYFGKDIIYIIGLEAILLIPLFIVLSGWGYKKIGKLFGGNSTFKRLKEHGDRYFAAQSNLNRPSVYIISSVVTVPALVLNALGLYFTMKAFGLVPAIGKSIFTFSLAQLIGVVSMAPGTIGVTDGALVALLGSIFGIGKALSSAITITTRFATLWFGIGIGLIFLFYSFRYWKE